MNLFQLDQDMQSTIGMLVFWLIVGCLAMGNYKSELRRTTRKIAVGECLKPNNKPKFHEGDIMRGGKYVE